MARVFGVTALVKNYGGVPALIGSRTGPGTIYPFGPWLSDDPNWDLFAALCARVTAWRYSYNNRITVSFHNTASNSDVQYEYLLVNAHSETPLDFTTSTTYPGSLPSSQNPFRPFPVSPPSAVSSEKMFAHPFTYIVRGGVGSVFGNRTGTITSSEDPEDSISIDESGAGFSGALVTPDFNEPLLHVPGGVLTQGPTFKSGAERYLALTAQIFFGDDRSATAQGMDPGEWGFTDADGNTSNLNFNIVIAGLIDWPGYREVGTLTINWPHWNGEARSVVAPLYAADPGSGAELAAYTDASVEHVVNVTMDPVSFLPYGRDPEDPNAYSIENPIYDTTTGEALQSPLGLR